MVITHDGQAYGAVNDDGMDAATPPQLADRCSWLMGIDAAIGYMRLTDSEISHLVAHLGDAVAGTSGTRWKSEGDLRAGAFLDAGQPPDADDGLPVHADGGMPVSCRDCV